MKRIFNKDTHDWDVVPSEGYGPNKYLVSDADGNPKWVDMSGGGSGGGVFVVAPVEDGDLTTYLADCDFSDALAAVKSGKSVVLKIPDGSYRGDKIICLSEYEDTWLHWHVCYVQGSGEFIYDMWSWGSDNGRHINRDFGSIYLNGDGGAPV